MVGKMSTGGRFCLHDCERKRIIIGEELAIALDNIDRLKELMSGDVTTCERKGRSVVKCKASLVLLNSSNMPAASVPQERQALLNRMLLIRHLKTSSILTCALNQTKHAKPHPKFLTLISPPTHSQLNDMERGELPIDEMLQMKNNGKTLLFEESWKSFLTDNVHGLGHDPDEYDVNVTPSPLPLQIQEDVKEQNNTDNVVIINGDKNAENNDDENEKEDINAKLTFTTKPYNDVIVFDEVYLYVLDSFGLIADMRVMHKDAKK